MPRRYESNFFKMYYHREKLKHLRQTYEKENSVFFENELEYTLNDNSERSRQLGAACPLDLRPSGLSVIHFIPMRDFLKGGGG